MEVLIGLGIAIVAWCAFCLTMAYWYLEEICDQLKKIAEKEKLE